MRCEDFILGRNIVFGMATQYVRLYPAILNLMCSKHLKHFGPMPTSAIWHGIVCFICMVAYT